MKLREVHRVARTCGHRTRIYDPRWVIHGRRMVPQDSILLGDPRDAREALNNATLKLARAEQKPTCHNFFTVMHRRHYRGALCPHYAVLCYYLRYHGCLFICLASLTVLDLPTWSSAFSFRTRALSSLGGARSLRNHFKTVKHKSVDN